MIDTPRHVPAQEPSPPGVLIKDVDDGSPARPAIVEEDAGGGPQPVRTRPLAALGKQ